MRVLLLLGALVAVAFCGQLAGKALRGSRRGEGDDGPWRLRRLRGARDGGAAAADEASSRRAKGGWFSGESDDPPDVPDGASSKARVPAAAPTKSNASVANPPSPAVTFALGMVSACCVEQHRRRRDMHRAIFADYVAGRVGQREALPEGSMALYFVVGHPKDDPNFETLREGSELREELTTAKDIVRLKAEDSYLNLYKKVRRSLLGAPARATYPPSHSSAPRCFCRSQQAGAQSFSARKRTQTDMFLAWALLHTTARYIIKVDDDCYVNYRSLYDISLSNFGSDPYGVYLGSHHHFVPIRKASSKWYVSEEQWPNHCPESKYADGWMYMLSRDVASAASAVLRSASEFVDESTQSHPNPLTNETSVELWGVPELHTDPQLQGLPTTDGLRVPTWHPDLETRSASGPARDGNECSLNRIWFEDARVGIAVSRAFAGAEWVFSRLSRSSRYFASAWHCCYHGACAAFPSLRACVCSLSTSCPRVSRARAQLTLLASCLCSHASLAGRSRYHREAPGLRMLDQAHRGVAEASRRAEQDHC